LLVDSVESMMIHRLANPKHSSSLVCSTKPTVLQY